MSQLLIVPTYVTREINEKLDAARTAAAIPDDDRWKRERGFLFNSLLEYYDEHGKVPDFSLSNKAADAGEGRQS